MKTSQAEGEVLNYLVAKAEGQIYHGPAWTKYSTDWAQAGPIIERERIAVWGDNDTYWEAECGWTWAKGQTPLVAAMRAYVASKLGDEVEVPTNLFSEV
jgi:hypothetical protein